MKNSSSNSTNQQSIDIAVDYASYSIQISFGVLGIILNLAQFIMLYGSRAKRTLFEINLLSLCVADFLSSLCFVGFGGFGIYDLKKFIVEGQSYFDELKTGWFEASSPVLFRTTLMLSFTHIIFIAFQRLFSSLFPFRFKVLFTRKTCIFCIALLWIGSIGYGILRIFDERITNLVFVYTSLLCYVLLVTLYSTLYYMLRRRSKRAPAKSNNNTKHKETLRKVLLYSVCVTLAFIATTLPYTIRFFTKQRTVLQTFSIAFLPLNAVLNPLIYFLHGRLKNCSHNPRVHNFEQENGS